MRPQFEDPMSAPKRGLTARLVALTQVGLGRRTLPLAVMALLFGMLLCYVVIRLVLLSSFAELERRALSQDLARVTAALDVRLAALSRDAQVAAAAAGPTPRAYPPANLQAALRAAQLNLTVYVDAQGALLAGGAVDPQGGLERPLPERLRTLSAADPLLRGGAQQGLIVLPEGVLLVAVAPLTSSGGVAIVGRFADAALSAELTQLTQTQVHLFSPAGLPDDAQPLVVALRSSPVTVLLRSADQVQAATWVRGLSGEPALLAVIAAPRTVYNQSELVLNTLSFALGVTALIAGLLLLLLIQQGIVVRLTRLNVAIQQVRTSGSLSARLPEDGQDDLTALAQSINATFAALERAEIERAQAAQEASQTRAELIDMICHELRGPLTPASGFIDLLLADNGEELSATQRAALLRVSGYLTQLGVLIDDLLALSQLDTGSVVLQREPTDLRALIESVVLAQQPALTHKRMICTIVVAPLEPVLIDARRIGQVLGNLLSNAVKYTYPGGEIGVNATRDAAGVVTVQVTDTGIGMTAEQQRRLFTRFYRAETPLRDTVPGSGLGLTIARTLVQLHGGDLTVTSAPGRGSTFSFTLPPPAAESTKTA